MSNVKVLVAHHMGRDEDLAAIAAVDPRVDVAYGPYIDEMTKDFVRSYRAGGTMRTPDLPEGEFQRHVAEAEVIFGLRLPKNITEVAPKLKWVQVYGAGVDYLDGTGLLEKGVALTNSSGVNGPPIAEFCLMLMLMHAKRMVVRIEAQARREWTRYANGELAGKSLGIVGPGRIGGEVARCASAFDMRILAARRSYEPGQSLPHVDEVYPSQRLREMLGQCDYVVVAVSLTPETRGMISEAEFSAMRDGAFFINVSRGAVVDEDALLRALKDGPLGGAGLDVFQQEPLSPESGFWGLPNVIVTPHNSGGIRDHAARATQLFCENLKRYLAGQPLDNAIDPTKGY